MRLAELYSINEVVVALLASKRGLELARRRVQVVLQMALGSGCSCGGGRGREVMFPRRRISFMRISVELRSSTKRVVAAL